MSSKFLACFIPSKYLSTLHSQNCHLCSTWSATFILLPFSLPHPSSDYVSNYNSTWTNLKSSRFMLTVIKQVLDLDGWVAYWLYHFLFLNISVSHFITLRWRLTTLISAAYFMRFKWDNVNSSDVVHGRTRINASY